VTARNVARLAGQARRAAPLWDEPAFAEAEKNETGPQLVSSFYSGYSPRHRKKAACCTWRMD